MERKPSTSHSKGRLAFYDPPACVKKTSSEIINEAREAVMHIGVAPVPCSSGSTTAVIQPVNTKRPFTPRESQRTLFGRAASHGQRPSSSFSLKYLQFQDGLDSGESCCSNPLPQKKATHLIPMSVSTRSSVLKTVKEKMPGLSHADLQCNDSYENSMDMTVQRPNIWARLPSISKIVDGQDSRRKRRHHFRVSASLGNLPEEMEIGDGSVTHQLSDAPVRNAYSSPIEYIGRFSHNEGVLSKSSADVNHWVDSVSKGSMTPRKVMKCVDNGTGIFNDCKNMGEKPFSSEYKIHRNSAKNSSLSSTINSFEESQSSNTHQTKGQSLNAKDLQTNISLAQIERNLFGPDMNLQSSTEVDSGVFGEKLHDSIGVVKKTADSDGGGAMYDNHVNEAKLATLAAVAQTPITDDYSGPFTIQSKIKELNDMAVYGGADAAVMCSLDDLYSLVSIAINNDKAGINPKLKTQILKCVYRFVERSEDALLLKLARVIFCLSVTGSNLAGVCKLVFKVARSDRNDFLFMEGNILDLFVDALGSASPLEDAEACVYGYGALKFLTMNNQLLNQVLNLGALDLMVLHLKIVNASRVEGGRLPEQTSHAVFQLTGALRNIAGEESMFPLLVSHGAVTQLCHSLDLFSTDLDLVTNIARTFSILSTNDDCCHTILTYKSSLKLFIKLFSKYPGRQDIVVRLGYALGNLLARTDTARLQVLEVDGAMDNLLSLLQLYIDKDLQISSQEERFSHKEDSLSTGSGSDGSIEDVIIKVIRIIANMSMNMEVGERLTCPPQSNIHECAHTDAQQEIDGNNKRNYLNTKDSKAGERAVQLLLTLMRRKSIVESTELLLSTLSTLNNLTFYPSGTEHSVFSSQMMDLSQALSALLNSSLDECLVETTKVLGNLTRSKPARDFLVETGGLEQLLKFLQSDNHELLRTTTGVLVNLMADADTRKAFRQTQGISRLIALLLCHVENDWQLGSLVCQVLWNFCIDMLDSSWLGIDNANQLLEILVDFLDEESLFGSGGTADYQGRDNHSGCNIYQQWEEFAVIATNLLEKVESCMDSFQNIGSPQDPPSNQLGTTSNVNQIHKLNP